MRWISLRSVMPVSHATRNVAISYGQLRVENTIRSREAAREIFFEEFKKKLEKVESTWSTVAKTLLSFQEISSNDEKTFDFLSSLTLIVEPGERSLHAGRSQNLHNEILRLERLLKIPQSLLVF